MTADAIAWPAAEDGGSGDGVGGHRIVVVEVAACVVEVAACVVEVAAESSRYLGGEQ